MMTAADCSKALLDGGIGRVASSKTLQPVPHVGNVARPEDAVLRDLNRRDRQNCGKMWSGIPIDSA